MAANSSGSDVVKYAVKPDGSWRAVAQDAQLEPDETLVDTQPPTPKLWG